MSDDITIEILRRLRPDIVGAHHRIDGVNAKLDSMNERIDVTNDRLDALTRHMMGMETRLATEFVAVRHAVNEVRDVLRERLGLARTVADHERRIAALESGR